MNAPVDGSTGSPRRVCRFHPKEANVGEHPFVYWPRRFPTGTAEVAFPLEVVDDKVDDKEVAFADTYAALRLRDR
jgi:hypothetical protein